MLYMSANKDPQPDDPRRSARIDPTLGPLGEINLGSNFGFGATPSDANQGAKQPVGATPQTATTPGNTAPIPAFRADPIIFASKSATVSQEGLASTRLVAVFMAAAPATVHLTVKGYSDILGAADQNLILSQERADAVLAVLLSQNIAEARLTAEGQGSTNQFRAGQTAEQDVNSYHALRSNRRVQMELSIDLG